MLALFFNRTNLPKHVRPSFNAFTTEGSILPKFVDYRTYKVLWNIVDSPKKKDELTILSGYSNRLWSHQKSSKRSKGNESDERFYYEDDEEQYKLDISLSTSQLPA